MKIFLEENYELVQDGSPIFNLMAKDRKKKSLGVLSLRSKHILRLW